MHHIAHLESLQQWPVSFTELHQDACFIESILGEAQPVQQWPLQTSDRCEMALLLKGRSLLHMSSFLRQGQLPLLR